MNILEGHLNPFLNREYHCSHFRILYLSLTSNTPNHLGYALELGEHVKEMVGYIREEEAIKQYIIDGEVV